MTYWFAEFVQKTLKDNFGDTGEFLFSKVMAKKPIKEESTSNDLSEFIATIKRGVLAISDQEKANEIVLVLKNKLDDSPEEDTGSPANEKLDNVDDEIEKFLENNALPTDGDIQDFTNFLALKYKGSVKKVENNIIEKVKTRIKDRINEIKINEEIDNFLERFPQPQEKDVDDLVNYIRLLKISFNEDGLRDQIEKVRLYRKFHEPQETPETSELDQFIDIIKSKTDKKSVSKAMQKQKISYLIKDESGVSDKKLNEFMDIITPDEKDIKDALEEMGLEHMVKGK